MATFSNIIRLVPLQLEDLPPHPALELSVEQKRQRKISGVREDHVQNTSPQETTQRVNESETEDLDDNGRSSIGSFIKVILDSAVVFIDKTMPSTFKASSEKPFMPAKSRVQLLRRDISAQAISTVDWLGSRIPRHPPAKLTSEAWFARRSRHANQQAENTANFSEFDYGLRVDHCQHEGEYTPDVFDTHKVLEWTVPQASIEQEANFADYKDVSMSILVITAKTGSEEFIVVQLPVEIGSVQGAFYSNGRNLKEGSSALKRKKPIRGIYTSIERDAKGWLPMWAQKMAVPGAIAKDVDFVMKWIREKRKAKTT
ncbi:MAG: hypothetical protein Q9213_006148 [Squamulea squamosa]